jgi:hypothetical protein
MTNDLHEEEHQAGPATRSDLCATRDGGHAPPGAGIQGLKANALLSFLLFLVFFVLFFVVTLLA